MPAQIKEDWYFKDKEWNLKNNIIFQRESFTLNF